MCWMGIWGISSLPICSTVAAVIVPVVVVVVLVIVVRLYEYITFIGAYRFIVILCNRVSICKPNQLKP